MKKIDIDDFFHKIESGAFDKETIMKIISKLLNCAEYAHK